MSRVAVVTDSATHLPPQLTRDLPVFTLPFHLIWNGKSYLDDVDIQPVDFYNRLKVEKELPKTSQVTPGQFLTLYKSLLSQGYDILSIHISSKYTGTLDAAIKAKDSLPGASIEVLDSETGSMATGFHVLAAARAAVRGAALQLCKELAERARQYSNVFFVPGTLEFLRRGGRIGNLAALLGSVLQFKPILTTRNGYLEAVAKVRTMRRALDRVVDLVAERVGDRAAVHLAALHSNWPEKAAELLVKTSERLGSERISESVVHDISPALGTHIGPGAVGLAYWVET
jgi:DegV family protein with EDD domain